ncbi:MAG TPA: four helix bundle protein [Cyclobacteriaceae bacterium]|nr:four helix bundle protein [Cyclobacteriaceae bacterium]
MNRQQNIEISKEAFVSRMRARTKDFALMGIEIFRGLPQTGEGRIIGDQFLRSSLSAAANYRAVCRARSKAEFFAKLSVTVEELDESLFWLEILVDSGIVVKSKTAKFEAEGQELVAILSTARRATR